mgnify:CR=1 FL=1
MFLLTPSRQTSAIGEWICGGAVHQTDFYGDEVDRWFIIDGTETFDNKIGKPIRVIPETIGQYTGLTDKNSTKIFEGDIVKGHWGTLFTIFYDEARLQLRTRSQLGIERDIDYYQGYNDIEVIGNIYDNTELLRGETE